MKAVLFMTRKEAREQAFVLIFEKMFRDDTAEEILEYATEIREIEVDDYSKEIFLGVCEKTEELDAEISKHLKNWKIERISKVALAILRLAVYEIKFVESVPESVSINEAVELSKKFSFAEDASFVNGVLGNIVK